MPLNLAIDLGRYSIKCIPDNNQKFDFPSVVGEGKVFTDIYPNGSVNMIEHDGKSYLYGRTALEQASFLTHDRDAQWVGEQGFLLLTLAAIGRVTQATNPKISIVTGLPHSDYKSRIDGEPSFKQKIIKALTGIHTIKTPNGPTQHITILEPSVFTQSLGSIWDWTLDDNGRDVRDLSGQRIGIINCGSQTTEMLTLYFDGKRPTIIEDATRSINSGFWIAAEALMNVCPAIPDSYLADEMLRSPSTSLERSVIDDYNRFLLSHCEQNWGEQKRRSAKCNIDVFLVCGGRGPMIADYLQVRNWHKNIILLDNPQWSTVAGYRKFIKRLKR